MLEETRLFQTPTGQLPNIGNVDILMKLAEVEIAQGNYDEALTYVSTALYVDPAYEPALSIQADLYLTRAAQTPNERTKQILYGYAAVVAEEQYLSRYPGAALGYIQVAEGRFREGNPLRALEYLERVLQVAGEPGVNEAAVLRGRALRAEILLGEQNYSAALEDLNVLIDADASIVQWRDWRHIAALAVGDDELALEDLDFLLTQFEPNPQWVIDAARLRSQTCQHTRDIDCDFDEVEALLGGDFH